MTQLAGGMASALKLRGRIHVGWLTPLTALVICLDIASFWPALWGLRDKVEIETPYILTGVALCLGYYTAAAFAFPDDMKETGDLDAWYFASGRFAIAGTLAVSAAFFLVADIILNGRFQGIGVWSAVWSSRGWIVYIALLSTAIFARDRRICVGALVSIVGLYPLQWFLFR